jgi:hypothetical protein
MTASTKLRVIVLAASIGFIGIEALERPTFHGVFALVSPAEARVGRPLTPVSVAGVARRTTRRTVRRCVAGVSYC